mgnify:CR=1 FL=1
MFIRQARTASGVCRIKSREESPFSEIPEGPKLTKASCVLEYRGELEGEGVLEELKVNFTQGRAAMYGLQRVTARLGDTQGSFVLHYNSSLKNGVLISKQVVVPGSGTGGLKGLRGDMKITSASADEFFVTFDYRFA